MLESEQKRKASLVYKTLIVLAAVVGILLQCEIGTSNFSLYSFRMFTTLSNLAVALFFAVYVVFSLRNSSFSDSQKKAFKAFKFLITMCIMLTGLVAHFMLVGMFDSMDAEANAGLVLLHYVVPIATVLDWLIFDIKGETTRKMPLFAAVFPVLYALVTMIAAQFMQGDGKYPYPFLNVDILGVDGVALNIVLLAVAFIAVGYAGVWVDHKLAAQRGR
ncbi:MAG: Pr6Pr family membrane protein [Phoenicibacter congonensis]|uniref:Pr6Pr family membrane protein n=1 Tax=Phoenicibacter congonensis TaxID=1944646 RepID=A0AA43RKC3_9ACTN|nr:Pr6Pr family membrane protein [Phoenicibacter congonensis]